MLRSHDKQESSCKITTVNTENGFSLEKDRNIEDDQIQNLLYLEKQD